MSDHEPDSDGSSDTLTGLTLRSDDVMKEHLLQPESNECSVESHSGSDDSTTGGHANQVPSLASLYYWPHLPFLRL